MATRVKVDCSKVVAALKAQSLRFKKNVKLEVGFGASYSVYVHENLQARHAPPTQAKFLEQPARQLAGQMGKDVLRALRQKKSLESGLLDAGLRLLMAARKLVPVETGQLRASGFVKVVPS